MKAIFFDRDDTLIADLGYMHKKEELSFFPDTFDVLKKLQSAGFALFIVTNQSGIGRGYFTESNMHDFHTAMLERLEKEKITILEISFCPHAPEDKCDCRKPAPKLINQLCEKYHINKKQSYMIGDKPSDKAAGENAGVKGVQLSPGHLSEILKEVLD